MVTRRSFFGQIGALAAAGPLLTEAALARQVHAARLPAMTASTITWLGSNENPAGPPAAAIEAMRQSVTDVGRYHIEELEVFADRIAVSENVSPRQVISGVGSSDVIKAAICAFASSSRPMITGAPSYDIVVNLARRLGKQVIDVPLTSEWSYPVERLADEARKAGGGFIYVCNPNNPTSSLTSTSSIDWLVTHLPPNTVLFVDEAYLEFVEPGLVESAMRYVREDRSVIVSRTFSKIYGMAGARAGFGCARPDIIAAMMEFMDNIIPILGLRAAVAALHEKTTLVPQRRQLNARIRGEFCDWLRHEQIPFIEPHANFVMIDTGGKVGPLGEAMLRKGVAVGRPFPPLDNMLRVTVGTDQDMRRFREAFKALRSA